MFTQTEFQNTCMMEDIVKSKKGVAMCGLKIISQ